MISPLIAILSLLGRAYAAVPQASVLKSFMGTFGSSMDFSSVDVELGVTFSNINEACWATKGFDGSATVLCNKNYHCPAVPAAALTPGTAYSSTFLVSSRPTFQAKVEKSKQYTIIHYDFGYTGGLGNIIHWLCVNVPVAENGMFDVDSAECYNLLGLPGATYPKQTFSKAFISSGNPARTASTYCLLLYEQSSSFGAVSETTGSPVLVHGIDIFLSLGGDDAAAKKKGGFFQFNLTSFAAASNMVLRAASQYSVPGNIWSGRYLEEKGLVPFMPACKDQADDYCKEVPLCPSTMKGVLGTMGASLDFSNIEGTLDVEFPALNAVEFEARGWDGAALVSCGKTIKCAATGKVSNNPGKVYSSTYLVSGTPSFTFKKSKSDKKYTVVHQDFGYAGGLSDILHWICVDIESVSGVLNMEAANCYNFLTLPGSGFTYPKKKFSDAFIPSGAPQSTPASTYAFMVFEQTSPFPSVTEATGTEFLKYGVDLFDSLGGEQEKAVAKGGFFMYNFTAFTSAYGMKFKAMNWYSVEGNLWSAKLLVDLSLVPFAPACDLQSDKYCTTAKAVHKNVLFVLFVLFVLLDSNK